MKLPAGGDVLIEERKVLDYLLSRSHPVGRFKARLFAALGFESTNVEAFVGELRRIVAAGEVSEAVETSFGAKYVVPGDLRGPFGELPVLTVGFWSAARKGLDWSPFDRGNHELRIARHRGAEPGPA